MKTEMFEKINDIVKNHNIVLFVIGTAELPRDGFSSHAVELLNLCGIKVFFTVNVLEDDELQQGIKEYSNWPTLPQLYIMGEFVGGVDIMREMYESGELQQLLNA